MSLVSWLRHLLPRSPEASAAAESNISDAAADADAARRFDPSFRDRAHFSRDVVRAELIEEEAPPDLAP